MDKKDQIILFKGMTEQLLQIAHEKEFAVEVLQALKTDEEMKYFSVFLENNPQLVQAEVYEELEHITNGRFHKEFSRLRLLRNQYLEEQSENSLKCLIDALCEDGVIVLCKWDLSGEEESLMESAEVGDTVHIESKPIPLLFEDEETSEVGCYVFTSELEISQESRSQFARCKWSFQGIIDLIKKMKLIGHREIVIYLDGESDQEVIITGEMLASVGY